mmetsp:Transcript_10216/g.11742  ORF Transcript_10216/g.11742 Transcript_10216/m.11742 type:complete len:327 (+) Transcript_10216:68-1048(+)
MAKSSFLVLLAVLAAFAAWKVDRSRPFSECPPIMREESSRRHHIETFFFQGNGQARSQGALYTGPEGIKSLDRRGNEYQAHSGHAPRLLHNVFPYYELEDIEYLNMFSGYNPFHMLLLGINWCKLWYFRIESTTYFNVLSNWNVGGKDDVKQHSAGFKEMVQKVDSDKRIVLFGPSRGAATTLISVSQMPRELLERIDLVIVEAPFDTVPSVLKKSVVVPVFAEIQLWLLEIIGKYDPNQVSPLDAVANFPLDIPVAFVTSRPDRRVPINNTKSLIEQLRDRKHENVHHLMLEHSRHSSMAVEHHHDQKRYFEFVEMLYSKYCPPK